MIIRNNYVQPTRIYTQQKVNKDEGQKEAEICSNLEEVAIIVTVDILRVLAKKN